MTSFTQQVMLHLPPLFHVYSTVQGEVASNARKPASLRLIVSLFSLLCSVLLCGLSFLTRGVVLQHRVLAEGLEPPGDQNILDVCRGAVVTAEDHRGKQSRAALLYGNNHLDAHRHCGGTTNIWLHTSLCVFVHLCVRSKSNPCTKKLLGDSGKQLLSVCIG